MVILKQFPVYILLARSSWLLPRSLSAGNHSSAIKLLHLFLNSFGSARTLSVQYSTVQNFVCTSAKQATVHWPPCTASSVARWTKLAEKFFTFTLPCVVIDVFLNNQPDALIILILFCYKTPHVSGIFSAHHQEVSTVYSALVSLKHVFDDRFQTESVWNCRSII